MKPENKFKKKILTKLTAHTTPMELYLKRGVPDIYGFYDNGRCFWLEFKCSKMKKVNISPLQISWNYKHFLHNPINFYLVNDPRRKVIELYDGNKGRELLKNADEVRAKLTFSPQQYQKLLEVIF